MARSTIFTAANRCDSGSRLEPGARTMSSWRSSHIRGIAVSGAHGREREQYPSGLGRTGLTPVRWTVDLLRSTRVYPIEFLTKLIRNGLRLCLVDTVVTQGVQATARTTAGFAASGDAQSSVWTSGIGLAPPTCEGDDHPPSLERLHWDEERRWLAPADPLYGGGRRTVWHFPIPIVAGEDPTAFVTAAATMHLSRRPAKGSIGLALTAQSEDSGLSAASAVVFDRAGPFVHVTAAGRANPLIALPGHPLPDSLPSP